MISLPEELVADIEENIRLAMRVQHHDGWELYHECRFCHSSSSRYGETISHYDDCDGERMLRAIEEAKNANVRGS